MNFAAKLAQIQQTARQVRESMTIVDPRTTNVDGNEGEKGYRRTFDPRGAKGWDRKVYECAKLIDDVRRGRVPEWHLKEAMTTDDFPLLYGDVLNRQMLGRYTSFRTSYQDYFRITTVNDFRTTNLYTMDGGTGFLTRLKEREPYPEFTFSEARYQISVNKYGKRYSITWEMIVNDDLNAFEAGPTAMAEGARYSEEYLATTMAFDANGPHASFFTSGNLNIVTSNPALSTAALQTAWGQLGGQVNSDGQPIVARAAVLVVPPALVITAQNILNATEITLTEAGGTAGQTLTANNWMRGLVKISVNPFIPIIATAKKNSWLLVADPGEGRPAFTFAFLRGRTDPALFIKDPNARRIGGGDIDPQEGNFDSDAIDYKVRHVYGAAQVDPKSAMGSAVT